MFTTILRVLAAAIVIGMAGQPAVSLAVEKPATTSYTTQFVQLYGSPGPVTGSLQLRITPENIVNGYYRPDGGLGTFIPITGGRDGDNVWFDIGYHGEVHVTARFVKGALEGSAVDHQTQYHFTATKAPPQAE